VQTTSQAQADRRATDRDAPTIPTTVQLTLQESGGNRTIIAKILSISYSGMGVNCNQPLCPGTKLTYTHPTRDNKEIAARIAWCRVNEDGQGFEHGISNESFEPGSKVDHYTVLQVHVTAEPATIDEAYQRLGRRYHPENPETANAHLYERVLEAYAVLSDPVKRTAYENERKTNKGGDVVKGERNKANIVVKRNEMLQLLYWRRVESPYKPVITIHEFETILKIPKEQMEFNLWFLRDNGLIVRADNACFSISAQGVAAAEEIKDDGLPTRQEMEEVA